MKLIALKDFRNVADLRLKDADEKTGALVSSIPGKVHDDHIHKGAVFDLGTAKDMAGLSKQDKGTASLVAQLVVSGCVGDANNPEVVKSVQAEIVEDKKRDESAAKRNAHAQASHLGEQLLGALTDKLDK